ncbi:MAG TPA: M20/M25/M40 family metallo-hydrolase, partial [Actinomycetales bacterium]|nr:M20/M25/M40 family metallo-hydrolase [Actinomycetales bacterium]
RSPEELGHRLLQLCQHPTVAAADHTQTDPAPFHALHATMAELYPILHERLEVERVGELGIGLLFRWAGSDESLAREPLVLMAHQDVVPVDGQDWSVDPFEGALTDGESAREGGEGVPPSAGGASASPAGHSSAGGARDIYGRASAGTSSAEGARNQRGDLRVVARGTLDDKGSMLTILEGVETLLAEGFEPKRDTYLFFGDCEEVAGATAKQVAALLQERGLKPWMVLDEGGAVAEAGVLPGVERAAAMIAVAEKGIVDVRLTATDPGGHASTPARGGATARIARAILELEKHPFKAHLPAPTRRMLGELGRHAPFAARLLYANVGPLEPLVARVLATLGPETGAMARTTVAVTQLSGSPAANVLATTATATLNVRVAVGVPVAQAISWIRRIIDDDSVDVHVVAATQPSRVSPVEGEQWDLLAALVDEVFPDAVAAPYVQNGATDSRRFSPWVDNVYRFAPLRMDREERARLHAADESISAATLAEGVRFVSRLIEEACG